ncbi:MAG: hypothetical protein K8S15_05850 [Candidatus Aegiribacteria sp.]|nr:hypothetical protein [Candidatus Aegiribacteria sp.]
MDQNNNSIPEENRGKRTFSSRVVRFAAWWFGYTGLLASTTPCPFCGSNGCPSGIGISSLIGALFAFLTSRGEKGSGSGNQRNK